MGIVSSLLSQSDNKMKFLLVLALAAYTKAEADPGFAYSIGHAPALTYAVPHAAPALTYAVPHVYTVPAGCQNSEGAFVPCAQGSYFGVVPVAAAAAAPAAEAEAAPAVVSVETREAEATAEADAEADPEADPWLYYSGLYGGHGYGYSHYAPLTYSYAPYTYSHVYNHYGLGHYGLGYSGYYGRKKRGAEAEPEAVADPEADPWLLYGGYSGYGHGFGYGHAYAPYTYAAYHHPLTYFYGGCRNNQGGLVPCAGR